MPLGILYLRGNELVVSLDKVWPFYPSNDVVDITGSYLTLEFGFISRDKWDNEEELNSYQNSFWLEYVSPKM